MNLTRRSAKYASETTIVPDSSGQLDCPGWARWGDREPEIHIRLGTDRGGRLYFVACNKDEAEQLAAAITRTLADLARAETTARLAGQRQKGVTAQ